MKTIGYLEKAVNEYMERHGHKPKYTQRKPDELYYYVEAFDYTELEGQIIPTKTGSRVVFKVDGKVTSIKK